MPFITQGKTNWKFLLIVIILAIIVGGGSLWLIKHDSAMNKLSEIESPTPNKKIEIEVIDEHINKSNTIAKQEDIIGDENLKNLIINSVCDATDNGEDCYDKTYYLEVDIRAIDLNGDGVEELINYPVKLNTTVIPGVFSNNFILIYQKNKDGWKTIGNLEANSYTISNKKMGEYYDISTYSNLSADCVVVEDCSWNEIDSHYKIANIYYSGDCGP